MARRAELQAKLESILGAKRVYFQPPATIRLEYPCIIYNLSYRESFHADNAPYAIGDRYMIMIIDRDPDSKIHEKVGWLPTASFDRSYTVDNLNHWIYLIYH